MALQEFPLDPRISRALAGLFRDRPYPTGSSARLWIRVLDVLKAHRDARTNDAHTSAHPGSFFFPEPALSEADLAALARFDAAPARAPFDPAELYREIRNNPDDDAPRLVLADLLTQAGDPRGEFIALQCARAAGRGTKAGAKREKELLQAHGSAWFGRHAARMKDPIFERGFLASARYSPCDDFDPEDPIWAGIRSLQTPWKMKPEAARALPGFRALHDADLDLLEDPDSRVEEASVRASPTGGARASLDAIRAPRLRRLWLLPDQTRHGSRCELLRHPLIARLEEWGVADNRFCARWLAALADAPPSLRRLVLLPSTIDRTGVLMGWQLAIARGADGAFSEMEVSWQKAKLSWQKARESRDLQDLPRLLAEVPDGALARVALLPSAAFRRPPPRLGTTPEDLQRPLAAALTRVAREAVLPF